MFRMKVEEITRTFLIQIAEASSVATSKEIKMFIAKLIESGQYTEATEDEIEELDNIMDALEA